MYILAAIIVALLILLWLFPIYSRVAVKSRVDGNYYHVLDRPDKQDAADCLGRVNTDIMRMLRRIKFKYRIDMTDDEMDTRVWQGGNDRVRNCMSALLDNYNYEQLYEVDPDNFRGDTAYTIGKGSRIYLCLRSPSGSRSRSPSGSRIRSPSGTQFVDHNTLMFVTLHELSHVANYDGWGHGEDFWEVFRMVLEEAVDVGVYKYVDYAAHPIVYCGLTIEYQPLGSA